MIDKTLFKLISHWLLYPEASFLHVDWEEIIDAVIDAKIKSDLTDFLNYYRSHPLQELQENYVQTFDFNRNSNLYLTGSTMITENKRGLYLAELSQTYKKAGYVIKTSELPDYLPLFLEFASLCEEEILVDLIQLYKSAIEEKYKFLKELNSPYALVFDALLRIIDSVFVEEEIK